MKYISYHVSDFLISNEKVIFLELGHIESNYSGRISNSHPNTLSLAYEDAKKFGKVEIRNAAIRDQAHYRSFLSESYPHSFFNDSNTEDSLTSDTKDSENTIVRVAIDKFDYYNIDTQWLTQYYKEENNGSKTSVFGSKNDTLWLAEVDKYIFYQLIENSKFSSYIPKTLFFDLDNINELDTEILKIQNESEQFIIKPTRSSCAKGLFIIDKADLFSVLSAIQSNYEDPKLSTQYKELFAYYISKDKNSTEREIVLQPLIAAPIVKQNGNQHRATGRVAFSVIVAESGEVTVKVIDLFWQLAPSPVTLNQSPDISTNISAKAYQKPDIDCWPDMSPEDKAKIATQITGALKDIATVIYQNPIKTWINKLENPIQKRNVARQMMLTCIDNKIYCHGLDDNFINLLIEIDKPLALEFILVQAKEYAMAYYLDKRQNHLQAWVFSHIDQFTDKDLHDLKIYFSTQLSSLQSSLKNKDNIPDYKALIGNVDNELATRSEKNCFLNH